MVVYKGHISTKAILRMIVFLLWLIPIVGITQNHWSIDLKGIGTFSSPRCADLNKDGVKDIIIGAGREEFIACDSAIIAIDGDNGTLLWHVAARDQVFGSAALHDLNGDSIVDVVIGGRSGELKAISGASGELLWEFFQADDTESPREAGWYNFYNVQFIDDQNGDFLEDILVANGGDVKAEPYDPQRPPGQLLILCSATGKIIAQATMPDDKETYYSVISYQTGKNQSTKVVFGTGGETIGGHLFVAELEDLASGDLSNATILASSPDKGFIAPPVAIDLNQDQILDLVAVAVDGTVYAFDGNDFSSLWTAKMEGCEAYSSLAIGHFNRDSVPDLFLSIAAGVWPKLEWNRQFMLDGNDGKLLYFDSLGFYQTSTGVSFDFDRDGVDEVILSLNYQVVDEFFRKFFHNMIVFIDFVKGEVSQLGVEYDGNNISTTPWMGDLDDDGYLDIIYVHASNLRHTYTFDGMQIHRLATQFPIDKPLKWGAYMGSNYDGIFR